ncbi:MAG: coenzyme F420-0:L-glutamate ligase [Thaumarchaeota archaeon]|nr:coenzyme F420-0:L-glutamate ligase [Nitrososphaerota archaeon]
MELIPVKIDKEVGVGDDLVGLMLESETKPELQDNDIIMFTQKIISKQEGRTINLSDVKPSLLATGIASEYGKDPRVMELIMGQTKRIVRMRNGIIISETFHGFICANAGVDESNVPEGSATLLPADPDLSAESLRRQIKQKTGKDTAIVISDTFGRPFRQGQTNVAIGLSGMEPILDYAGKPDSFGRLLRVTAIAIADELSSATELVMGKSLRTPICIIRNFGFSKTKSKIDVLIRQRSEDLFR